MGRVSNRRKNADSKKKGFKKSRITKRRARDIDQIQDELKNEQEKGAKLVFELDEDLPGLGQFYCTPCARHFADQTTLDTHCTSKPHKRRLKDVAQEQYTQDEADRAATHVTESVGKD